MKKLVLMSALFAFAFAVPAAHAADTSYKSETEVSKDSDGDVKSDTTTSSTDAAGTDRKDETEVKVDRDSNGDYKKTTETTSKTDPKGLFNTRKSKDKTTVKKKNGKVTTEHKKEVNGDTVEDTTTETQAPATTNGQ